MLSASINRTMRRRSTKCGVWEKFMHRQCKSLFTWAERMTPVDVSSAWSKGYGPLSRTNRSWIAMAIKFLHRPWFTCVWVIQEIFNGMNRERPSTVVICGDDVVRWDILATAILEVCKFDAARAQDPREIPHILHIGSGSETGDLLTVLCSTRSSNATNPRDRYFAILPLVRDDGFVRYLASYRDSVTFVYTRISL